MQLDPNFTRGVLCSFWCGFSGHGNWLILYYRFGVSQSHISAMSGCFQLPVFKFKNVSDGSGGVHVCVCVCREIVEYKLSSLSDT